MIAEQHVKAFNNAVRSGDFTAFVARFHPDAIMTFVGPPVGPFTGRTEIAAAYAAQPPTDTMEILTARTEQPGGLEVITSRWSNGGTGTMHLHHTNNQITALTVTFD